MRSDHRKERRRSYYWECTWQDDWSDPVADTDKLPQIPETQGVSRHALAEIRVSRQ